MFTLRPLAFCNSQKDLSRQNIKSSPDNSLFNIKLFFEIVNIRLLDQQARGNWIFNKVRWPILQVSPILTALYIAILFYPKLPHTVVIITSCAT